MRSWSSRPSYEQPFSVMTIGGSRSPYRSRNPHSSSVSPSGTTGQPKSVVEVYQARDGRLAGKVVEILDLKDGPNPACDKCNGNNRGKPIKGLVILWGLSADGAGKWSGGRVMDPENGKDYKARLELLDGGRKLGMSGCIAFLCRQQVWLRD